MRILLITQYYVPETGAPQNRLHSLALELKKLGTDVEVLTSMPNYPSMKIHENYKGKFSIIETIDGIKVYRGWIYASKNRGILSRLLNYFSFVFTSYFISYKIKENFDFVLCESPPLFLGISAYYISKRKMAKFIFNVSDLWPESAEKLGIVTNKFFLKTAYNLESWLYKKSILVTGQTQGICQSINERFPTIKTHWLPNGIDAHRFNGEVKSNWREKNNFKSSDFILFYGGIIGHAQGLEVIIDAAEVLKEESDIKFILLGDGPEKEKLKELVKNKNIPNVLFFDSVKRDSVQEIIQSVDASIIPLKRLELFKGAIPSKIFESLALQKPILLGVEGEAKELFIDKGNCGLSFEPENSEDLSNKIISLKKSPALVIELGKNGKEYVYQNFDREKIALSFYDELKKINER